MTSIIDVLQELEIEHRTEGHEHCRRGWIQIDCPYCSPGWSHFRYGINISNLYGNCWACGPHYLADALARASSAPERTVALLLRSVAKDDQSIGFRAETHQKRNARVKTPPTRPLAIAHEQFLRSKGFDPKELRKLWGISGTRACGRLSWRIFIPILLHGKMVSWTTRATSKGVRYISASPQEEIITHKELLYGEDYCRNTIIVVEGPTDVWRIGPGAAATFGTSFTQPQVMRMSKYAKRIICYDAEGAAQRRAAELCSLLEVFPGETMNVILETGKDPGEADESEIQELRRML